MACGRGLWSVQAETTDSTDPVLLASASASASASAPPSPSGTLTAGASMVLFDAAAATPLHTALSRPRRLSSLPPSISHRPASPCIPSVTLDPMRLGRVGSRPTRHGVSAAMMTMGQVESNSKRLILPSPAPTLIPRRAHAFPSHPAIPQREPTPLLRYAEHCPVAA